MHVKKTKQNELVLVLDENTCSERSMGSVTSLPFEKIMTDRAGQPTNQQTDEQVEVTLPISYV